MATHAVPALPERFRTVPSGFKQVYVPSARTMLTIPRTWSGLSRWETLEQFSVQVFAFLPHRESSTYVTLTVYDRVTDLVGDDVEEPEKALSKMILQLTVDQLERDWVQAAKELEQQDVVIRSLRYYRPDSQAADGTPTPSSTQVEDCIALTGQNALLHVLYHAPTAVWEKDEPVLATIKTSSLFWYDPVKWESPDQLGGVTFRSLW